jgi:hypothetical protein
MMNHLLADAEEAAQSHNTRVKKFPIKSVQGKNIYRVICLLYEAMKQLKHINKISDDMVKTLLTVDTTVVIHHQSISHQWCNSFSI